jgi:hypothetical protein
MAHCPRFAIIVALSSRIVSNVRRTRESCSKPAIIFHAFAPRRSTGVGRGEGRGGGRGRKEGGKGDVVGRPDGPSPLSPLAKRDRRSYCFTTAAGFSNGPPRGFCRERERERESGGGVGNRRRGLRVSRWETGR